MGQTQKNLGQYHMKLVYTSSPDLGFIQLNEMHFHSDENNDNL
jgi:hypothetical protein